MISVLHLIWIVPVSAVAGICILVFIVLTDDCLYWANNRDYREDHHDNE
jgi:hypothetical protein